MNVTVWLGIIFFISFIDSFSGGGPLYRHDVTKTSNHDCFVFVRVLRTSILLFISCIYNKNIIYLFKIRDNINISHRLLQLQQFEFYGFLLLNSKTKQSVFQTDLVNCNEFNKSANTIFRVCFCLLEIQHEAVLVSEAASSTFFISNIVVCSKNFAL